MKSTGNNTTEKRQYGTLSMVAIIVGMVIGSGIFIKNQSLMEGTESVILTTIAWIIGGLVVLSMMLAFIEVSSITKLKGEQGTFKNWSRNLFNEKTSRYVGVYFTFIYFPLVLAAETVFSAQKFFEIGGMDQSILNNSAGDGELWFAITGLSVIIVFAAFMVNSLFVKPGKVVNSTGSIIKLIPLFAVIFTAIVIAFGLTINGQGGNEIFNPDSTVNTGMDESGGKQFASILMVLPGVLFAFDGFLYANSMSNETKSPNTFKRAVIIAIVFITLTYILFSIGSMYLAPVEDGGDAPYELSNILTSLFGDIVGDVLIAMIFISILTATFGYAVTTMWALSDYSETNDIKDANGKLLRRNKVGNPQGAGMKMLMYALLALIILRGFDITTIYFLSNNSAVTEPYSSTIMTDYTTDVFTVFNFGFYAFIIFGAMLNRRSNKNEVEKIKGFWVFSIFALIVMVGVVGYMGYDIIFNSIISPIFGIGDTAAGDTLIAVQKLILFIAFVSTFIGLAYFLDKQVNETPKEVWAYKRIYRKAYELHVPYDDFKDELPNLMITDYTLAYQTIERIAHQKIGKSPDVIEVMKEHGEPIIRGNTPKDITKKKKQNKDLSTSEEINKKFKDLEIESKFEEIYKNSNKDALDKYDFDKKNK